MTAFSTLAPPDESRLVVVSNRLPVTCERDAQRTTRLQPGAGGLITALNPILRERHGLWIGWPGPAGNDIADDALSAAGAELGYELQPVPLTPAEVAGFYEGFANEVLWPLFHDLSGHCNFDPSHWPIYRRVNHRFARRVAERSTAHDYVWVHDYQLMLVARELEALGVQRRVGFFLHIPFPPLDMFVKLPWRQEILEAVLHYDLVGFQTPRDVRNFIQCLRHRIGDIEIERYEGGAIAHWRGREIAIGAFPISIDYAGFLHRSVDDSVSELVARIRTKVPSRTLILGLDRLDYTKGIPRRLEAFDAALRRHPELRGKVTLFLIVVPSRTGVEEYQQLKEEIDRLVGRVNGDYTAAGWTPIQYIFHRLGPKELLAYYRACDIALITPLKDGMNLVCKEYCACSLEDDGVLILSEFAGAADELSDGALLVNPYDIDAVADTIHRAVTMPMKERTERMRRLRAQIRDHNVFVWAQRFLAAAKRIQVEAAPAPIATSAASEHSTSSGSASR